MNNSSNSYFPAIQQYPTIYDTEKRFKCVHCGKAFKQKVHLMKHIRTHTGEKPFVCPVCNTAFRQKEHLKSHQWVHVKHNTINSPLAYNCTHCGATFKSSYCLQRHFSKFHK